MINKIKSPLVVSIGDLVTDIVVKIPRLPVESEIHQLAHQISLEPGGAGNFLIAGKRLGMDMIALGTIGDDTFGKTSVNILAQEGVDIENIIQQENTNSTTVIVIVDDTGKHVFLGVYGTGPTIEFPGSWNNLIPRAHAIFTSGYTLREKRVAEAALKSMQTARRLDIPIFFDPGPDMVEATPGQISTVLETCHVILLTEEEIPSLTAGALGLISAQELLSKGPQLVCVKRGSQGCVIFTKSETVEHSGYHVPVLDTTGAGDSFAAAFIYACLRGWPLTDIAAFANAMGAAKVQKMGSGTQVPTSNEVRGLLKSFHVKLDF